MRRADRIVYALRRWWIELRLAALDPRPWTLASSLLALVWGVGVLLLGESAGLALYDTLSTLPLALQGVSALALGTCGVAATPGLNHRAFVLVNAVLMLFWLWPASAFVIELGMSTALVYFAFACFNVWALYRGFLARMHLGYRW
jgi:hypothetical protein